MKKIKQTKNKKAVRKQTAQRKRPLHRRISLHPITILFLLCVGVLMFGLTFRAIGASSTVSMQITHPPLSEPAIITNPLDQARYTSPDISVKGTCPTNSYVKLYKNDLFNGSAQCLANTFEFTVTLGKNVNTLRVQAYNFSDEAGPVSSSITVFYAALTPSAAPNTAVPRPSFSPANTSDSPLRIIADYTYSVHKSEHPIQLNLALTGGAAPYAVAIDWNDGKITPIARQDTSAFTTDHVYAKKPRIHTYVIKIAVSDLHGNTDYIQLMTVVDGEEVVSKSGSTSQTLTPTNTVDRLQSLLKYIWPVYIIVVLMVLCFYLGEREEYRILTRKKPV